MVDSGVNQRLAPNDFESKLGVVGRLHVNSLDGPVAVSVGGGNNITNSLVANAGQGGLSGSLNLSLGSTLIVLVQNDLVVNQVDLHVVNSAGSGAGVGALIASGVNLIIDDDAGGGAVLEDSADSVLNVS